MSGPKALHRKKPWLILPYSLVNNDFKYGTHLSQMVNADDFYNTVKDAVDMHLIESRYAARAQAGNAAASSVAAGFGVPKMFCFEL